MDYEKMWNKMREYVFETSWSDDAFAFQIAMEEIEEENKGD